MQKVSDNPKFAISIHAPHTGRDVQLNGLDDELKAFQSTRPIRGATIRGKNAELGLTYFNPRAPYGARPTGCPIWTIRRRYFNPRAPYGARLALAAALGVVGPISIHAPHTGRDTQPLSATRLPPTFQSTRPIRGATISPRWPCCRLPNFNPRAPYGARPKQSPRMQQESMISIHAPHTGRDEWTPYGTKTMRVFQSTRPIRGATSCALKLSSTRMVFQSTRPIRGATVFSTPHTSPGVNFNPRAPYGARLADNGVVCACIIISIHAPHTGRDPVLGLPMSGSMLFQSTRPIRGATPMELTCRPRAVYFNPRAPYGARPRSPCRPPGCRQHFNPRAPYGARRALLRQPLTNTLISIHAPHTGRDGEFIRPRYMVWEFQSTRPIRGATSVCGQATLRRLYFNPRAPYGARQSSAVQAPLWSLISIHAPHTGRDGGGAGEW